MKDVVVIGGGAGGVPAAVRAAQLGGKVAIVERDDFGGLCMNRGCIPFGHMMVAANILRSIGLAKDLGLEITGVSKDYATLKKRQDELIEFMRLGVKGMLKKNNVETVAGAGKIAGPGKVEVNGQIIATRNIILATGGRWVTPDFPGADSEGVINGDEFLHLDWLPERAFLCGRSPWVLEIAQFLRSFGSEVHLAAEDKNILPDESKTMSSRLRKALSGNGIAVKTRTSVVGVANKKDGLHVEVSSKGTNETVAADKLIYADRVATLKGLGLKNVNIDEDAPFIKVSEKMETDAKGVYAIGDVTGPPARHYSHLSSEGGIVAAENAMGQAAALNPMTFTRVLFTQPQVACVGLTPKEAKNAGYDVLSGAAPLSMNPFGMIIADTEGIVEVVADKRYGEILGVHFIGRDAADMAGQAVLAIQMEATLEDLARAVFPHPTLSESLTEAARDALGRAIYLP
jgi:dihydrolipoamide dehydrogenase